MASAADSIRDYGVAAPHGPYTTGEHQATQDIDIRKDMSENEASVFHALLHPDDLYIAEGTYWADLPIGQRVKFVGQVDAQEAKAEASYFWNMFKNDPLAPIGHYFRTCVIPGAGLGLEGYVLFSIGNVRPLLKAAFPDCWGTHEICDKTWTQAVDYLEICGIIVGQILVGVVGDWLGRRFGLIQDATIMFVGLLMLTAAWGVTQNGWVICYVWALFFYGIGVGGEYPMTATAGMENAVGSGKVSTRDDRLHRGRKVTSAFLMQGWGQFFNQVILIILLLIFHGGSSPPYSKTLAQWTYRVSFAIPAVGTLWLVYFRYYKMKSASKQLMLSKKKSNLYGRKWMMIVGFLADFVLFMVPGFALEYFTSIENIHGFQAMYFLSSFFNQFGPNSVTFLVAAEVFPTPVRATAHGFSAAWGKLGALLAAILYNYIDIQTKFYFVPWFGLAGALLTLLFLPDTTGLDLKEQERRWTYIRAGREHEYHGIAIHWKHLSWWERFRGQHKGYDAKLDYEQKIDEMRADWVERQQHKFSEKNGWEGAEADEDDHADVHNYFKRTTPGTPTGPEPMMAPKAVSENSSGDEITSEKRAQQ
ncbi:hypothetical protein GGP41_005063 [Bipolaris sorokiniana]|uniref:Major facilitator superfamily (MFS) profile domain-containing protein n=1 Tax=Cochliobolus sativus TaxID=45130 RepID=A0A8H6DVM8_COCSA|nr:hypothetical protein GGP41_005063 [Bipolaris sorokiniana]